MRKVTIECRDAFLADQDFNGARDTVTVSTDREGSYHSTVHRLHGTAIAVHHDGETWIRVPRLWNTVTTRERLNGYANVWVRKGTLHINGVKVDPGDWIKIVPCQPDDGVLAIDEDTRRFEAVGIYR